MKLSCSDGTHRVSVRETLTILPPVEARIEPLTAPVMVGEPVTFHSTPSIGADHGARLEAGGRHHRRRGLREPHLRAAGDLRGHALHVTDGTYRDEGMAIVRVHTPETLRVPQVYLDTDQKNEVDDQHYLGYAVFSELDVLGVNSIHHGGGQEPVNHADEQVGTAAEFSAAMATGLFGLVITEADLDWSDGLEVVELIRDLRPDCPIILFTSSAGTDLWNDALRLQVDGYVANRAKDMSNSRRRSVPPCSGPGGEPWHRPRTRPIDDSSKGSPWASSSRPRPERSSRPTRRSPPCSDSPAPRS